jgi:hypothetical protein
VGFQFCKFFESHFQAVFERLVDIICDKMSDSLDTDTGGVMGGSKGTVLTDSATKPAGTSCC